MRLRFKVFFILLSLLVFIPTFLLSTQPAFAFASHIVKLKYEDGTPVVNKMVILRGGEFDDCDCGGVPDNECWCHDCSRTVSYPCNFDCGFYWTGPTWTKTTDSHGIAVFSAKDCSNTICGIFEGSIQACSIGRVLRLVMGVAYLNNQGYWRLDNVSNRSGSAEAKDDKTPNTCIGHVRDRRSGTLWDLSGNESPDEILRFHLAGDQEWCMSYWTDGFSGKSFGSRANMGVTALDYNEDSMGSPNRKSTNIYWEWTWIGSHAQNTQNQSIFAFAGNLWASLSKLLSL